MSSDTLSHKILSVYHFNKDVELRHSHLHYYGIVDKIYTPQKDDKGVYVNLQSIVVNDIESFNNAVLNNSITCGSPNGNYHNISITNPNNIFRMYAPIVIKSLYSYNIVVTLKKESLWGELLCDKIEISKDFTIKVHLAPGYLITAHTKKCLNLENCLIDRCIYVKSDLMYSIEVQREMSIPFQKWLCGTDEGTWVPTFEEFNEITFEIDYDKRVIWGEYSCDNYTGHYRRTSNGWEEKWLGKYAIFYKSFDLISNLIKDIALMDERLTSMGTILLYSTDGVDYTIMDAPLYPKQLKIKFNAPTKFTEINKIINFVVKGYIVKDYI